MLRSVLVLSSHDFILLSTGIVDPILEMRKLMVGEIVNWLKSQG